MADIMNILFHLTSPPPAIQETDAAFQEVAALQRRFGGSTINLFPLARPSVSGSRPTPMAAAPFWRPKI